MQGKEIPPPVDSSIRLFADCQAMEFRHLPMAGGIYDQSPRMMDRFRFIFMKINEQREREEAERERKSRTPTPRRIRGASRATY